MRVVLQRVRSASVTVAGEVVADIDPEPGQGLVALVGVTHGDEVSTARAMAHKIWRLRILDGELSASDAGAPILVVSQFTLYANTAKGRRPSWNQAAPGPLAEVLVEALVEHLRALGAQVQTGLFGADMRVELVGDGPVTLILEL